MRYLLSGCVTLLLCSQPVAAQSLTITLRSTQTLPVEDTVYLVIPPEQDYPAGSYPMQKRSARRWQIQLTDVTNGTLKFHFSRNDLGTPSYDKFKTDRPNKKHRLTINHSNQTETIYLHRWRWYTPQQLDSDISQQDWIIADRDTFILGMGLIDYHWEQFNPLIKSTMANIADNGFEYVNIAMSPTIITG